MIGNMQAFRNSRLTKVNKNVLFNKFHLISFAILVVLFLSSCAPSLYCEVFPDTSFTAKVMQLNLDNREIVARHNNTTVIVQLASQSSILNSNGSVITLSDLLVGQQLSIQGILFASQRVEATDIRLVQ